MDTKDPAGRGEPVEPAIVRLTVPAAPGFVQVARLAGSALASRAGFSIDEVDDLRIAIDELAAVLVQATGGVGDLELIFELDDDGVRVQGRVESPAQPSVPELTEKILDVVVDSYDLAAQDGKVSFRCEKRRTDEGDLEGEPDR